MLKLLQSVVEHLPFSQPSVAFEPVVSDDDELTNAIDNDVHTHENDWQLHERVDASKLDAFWDDVLHELGPDETNDE